ncbi:uncharacterized protein DUF397 [Stackebrandtia endophytica]|uniref:Uncharacterized protein DUF397 n=1 Tax=Stackebrandtia endophytica TaxID=1496996 RepID=A0A543AY72_9ACTN|nr:DUF397 domain-containing protein [Stackebrandtia endophytica]TQL77524.1 uncharacterized protein DUF397 [Stackebrandtia endophytica]
MNASKTSPVARHSAAEFSWRRSSRSGGGSNGANCLEAAALSPTSVAIRDSKDTVGDYPILSIPTYDWTGLVTTIKSWRCPAR